MDPENYTYIEIIDFSTDLPIRRIEASNLSETSLEKAENGLNRNLNHERYYTMIKESDTELKTGNLCPP